VLCLFIAYSNLQPQSTILTLYTGFALCAYVDGPLCSHLRN